MKAKARKSSMLIRLEVSSLICKAYLDDSLQNKCNSKQMNGKIINWGSVRVISISAEQNVPSIHLMQFYWSENILTWCYRWISFFKEYELSGDQAKK